MCGRVYQTYRARQILRQAGTRRMTNQNNYKASHNLGPGNYVPVIRHHSSAEDNHREVDVVKWGYHIFGGSLSNARSEEASQKKTFKGLVNTTRCVMMVEGYFEWAPGKKPFVFRSNTENKFAKLADNNDDDDDNDNAGDKAPILYIAGVIAPDGSLIVMTRDALPGFKDIHHRMPVILDESEIDMWLDCKKYNYDSIIFSEILKNEKEKWSNISYYQIGPLVNNMNNDTEKILEPVKGLPKELVKPQSVPKSTGQSTNASGKSTPAQSIQGNLGSFFNNNNNVPRSIPSTQPTQSASQGNFGSFLNGNNVPRSISSTQPASQGTQARAIVPVIEQSTVDDECRIGDEDSGIWDETQEEEKVSTEEKKKAGKNDDEELARQMNLSLNGEDWEGLYDVLWGDNGESANEEARGSKKRKERDGEQLERDNLKQVKRF